jgi:hypothetical protein
MKPRVVLVLLLLLGSCKTDPSAGTPSPSPAVPMPLAGDALRIQGRWLVVYNELKRHALPEMNV